LDIYSYRLPAQAHAFHFLQLLRKIRIVKPRVLAAANLNIFARIRSAIGHGLGCPRFPCFAKSTSPGTHRRLSRFTWRALKLNTLPASATVM
jgi:hypothetical protein